MLYPGKGNLTSLSYRLMLPVLVVLLIITACKKDPIPDEVNLGPGPYVPPAVAIDKVSGYPNEVLTINYWDIPEQDQYEGQFNGQPIEVFKIGATLSFLVPDMAAGSYTFQADIDGKALEYDIQVLDAPVVGSADQLLQDVQSQTDLAFDSLQLYLDKKYGQANNYPLAIQQDLATWGQIETQAQQALSQMTVAEKEELAAILAANQTWIDAINTPLIGESYAFKTAKECKAIIKEGRDSLQNGATFAALGLGISAYWCGVTLHIDKKSDNSMSKAATLWEATENQFMQITLINLIGKRIDQLSKEIDELGGSPSIAEEIEEVDGKVMADPLEYCNGERKRVFADIRFRSVRPEDTQLNTPYAPFANFYAHFITAYEDYVATMTQPLVWRPEYRNTSRVEKFNRFLSVPKSSITNDKALLLNTQIVNDLWEVIFATDESDEQRFDYDIVYDDGYVSIAKTFAGTVGECIYEIGAEGPGGGIIIYDYGSFSGLDWRYVEITKQPIGVAAFGCEGDSSICAWYRSLGFAGPRNTDTLLQLCNDPNIAAALCNNYVQNGYSDWFLPSIGLFWDAPSYAFDKVPGMQGEFTMWLSNCRCVGEFGYFPDQASAMGRNNAGDIFLTLEKRSQPYNVFAARRF